jgi:fatty acyl-ACP thioesterase B
MMNKVTRRLSKIPEDVRGEIEPYFLNSDPVVNEDSTKLPKLDDKTADIIRKGLTVSRSAKTCVVSFTEGLITYNNPLACCDHCYTSSLIHSQDGMI